MDLQLECQFHLGRASQRFAKHIRFDGQLICVRCVLVLAAAAALKVRTSRINAAWRWFDYSIEARPRESRLLLGDLNFGGLALKNKWNENAFARATLVGSKAAETIASIDQLLDFELHQWILNCLLCCSA